MNVPQHPALQQQQGLGQPTAPQGSQGTQNPYYTPNVALKQATERINGAAAMKLAQAEQAGAMAGKAQAETEIMQGLQAMGQRQMQEQEISKLAAALMNQQANPKLVMEAARNGDVVAAEAIAKVNAIQGQVFNDQRVPSGLGSIQPPQY